MVAQQYLLTDHKALSTESRSDDKGGTTRYMHKELMEVERAISRYGKLVAV